jgi:hypothetical protein
MYVEAESAEEAVERARSTLADVAVYVDESAERLGDD